MSGIEATSQPVGYSRHIASAQRVQVCDAECLAEVGGIRHVDADGPRRIGGVIALLGRMVGKYDILK